MDLKIIFSKTIGLVELYKVGVHQIKYEVGFIVKNLIENLLSYISHTFWLWLYLHFQFLTKWYIFSLRFQQQSCSDRWDVSFDIHIVGGPEGVLNFIVSSSGEGGIKQLNSDSDSWALTTSGTIEKGQKFYYKYLSLIC